MSFGSQDRMIGETDEQFVNRLADATVADLVDVIQRGVFTREIIKSYVKAAIYTAQSDQIKESNKLVERCFDAGIWQAAGEVA